jgi:hypothetical protein
MTMTIATGQTDALAEAPYGSYRRWLFSLPVLVRGHRGSLVGKRLELPVPEGMTGVVTVVPKHVFSPYSNSSETWWVCDVVSTTRFYRGKTPIPSVSQIKVLESELRRSTPVGQ